MGIMKNSHPVEVGNDNVDLSTLKRYGRNLYSVYAALGNIKAFHGVAVEVEDNGSTNILILIPGAYFGDLKEG